MPYVGPIVAFIVASALILALRPVARRIGLVDVPNARKSHSGSIPLVGGLAIFLALGMVLLAWPAPLVLDRGLISLMLAGLLMVAVGMLDDWLELSAGLRLVFQICASLIMIFGAGVVLEDLGHMWPSGELMELGFLSVPFTIFATLGIINAMNMTDGLDGLGGSMVLVALTGLAVASLNWGSPRDALVLVILGAAVLGFLVFNYRLPGRSRAWVFLGDAGSMFLGLTLTWYAIKLSQGDQRAIEPAAVIWFLMLPIYDAVSMMMRRIVRGRSPFSADREHLHHVFLLAGFTVSETVAILTLVGVGGMAFGLTGFAMGLPAWVLALLFLLGGLIFFWAIVRAWKVMRFLRRSICRREGSLDRRMSADRRLTADPDYHGPERRSGADRREASTRRLDDRRERAGSSSRDR